MWGTANATPYVKDAFHEYVVRGRVDAVNPGRTGTKAAALYELEIPAESSRVVQLRLCASGAEDVDDVDRLFAARIAEADQFYASITPSQTTPDEAAVMRQALASMLWSKQHYFFDLDRWLEEHHAHPLRDEGGDVRNRAGSTWSTTT